MPTPDDPREKLPNPEAALGGADDVPKTTYVTGKGTEPETERRKADRNAKVRSGGGPNVLAMMVGVLIVIFALIYAAGLFR